MQAEYSLAPLHLPEGCLVELYADKPLHLSRELKELQGISYLLAFTDETLSKRLEITAHYAALLRGETPVPLDIQGTWGRFSEGVL